MDTVRRQDRPDSAGREYGLIFQDEAGELHVTIRHLRSAKTGSPYSAIAFGQWYRWLEEPSPHLDPGVNGGKIRAALAPDPGRPEEYVLVWLEKDTLQIADRWSNSQKRRAPAGRLGKWITDEVWVDPGRVRTGALG
jgi:hypothetical protein